MNDVFCCWCLSFKSQVSAVDRDERQVSPVQKCLLHQHVPGPEIPTICLPIFGLRQSFHSFAHPCTYPTAIKWTAWARRLCVRGAVPLWVCQVLGERGVIWLQTVVLVVRPKKQKSRAKPQLREGTLKPRLKGGKELTEGWVQEEHFWAVAIALAIGQGLGQLKAKGVPGIVLAEAKHVRGETVRN